MLLIKDGRNYKMVEVNSKVRLVDHTKNPENIIAEMARLCYADDEKVKSLFNGSLNGVEDSRMINTLAKMRHFSPFEHAKWTFEIEGVSRALTHQLVRHRLASYSQRSQRYVNQKNFEFIIPPAVKQAGMSERYTEMMETIGGFYEEISEALENRLGLNGEERNQDARYVLPNACETKIGVTMNARELIEVFFAERLCNRSQWEIRGLAHEMLKLSYPTAPNVFSHTGPACYSEGKCFQGTKSCGKAEEVRSYFKKLKEDYKQAL